MNRSRDILPFVNLSAMAVEAYDAFAEQVACQLRKLGLVPDRALVPVEQGCEQEDGSLLIWVDLPNAKMEFVIPKGEWEWSGMN